MPVVGSFQSAIQFVAGANLALFALPTLHQPALEEENRRWLALIRTIPPSQSEQDRLRIAMVNFANVRRDLEQRNSHARILSLWFAGVYGGILLWTSWAAERPTDGVILIAASAIGALPSLCVLSLNVEAWSKLSSSRSERNRLERVVMSAIVTSVDTG